MTFHTIFITAMLTVCSTVFVAAAESIDLVGTWDSKIMIDGDATEAQVVVTADGDKLSGVVLRNGNETKLKSISSEGSKVTFALDIDYEGTELDLTVKAEGTGSSLAGTWVAAGPDGSELATGDWTANKAETPIALAGSWDSVATTEEGDDLESVTTFKGEGDSLSGELKGESGTIKLTDIEVKGSKLQFDMVFPYQGTDIDIRVKAEGKETDVLEGKWIAFGDDGGEMASGPWMSKRAADKLDLVGAWDTVASMEDGSDVESVFHFAEEEGKLSGKSESDTGTLEFDTVKVSDSNRVTVDMELPYDGSTIDVRISAESEEADGLTGKWVVFNDAGEEAASGDWRASRKEKK